MHAALNGSKESLCRQPFDGNVLSASKHVGFSEFNGVKGFLRIKIDTEAALAIELAILVAKVRIDLLVDKLQRCTHRHGATVGLEHLAVARINTDTGANSRLSKVNRRDIRRTKFIERGSQLTL